VADVFREPGGSPSWSIALVVLPGGIQRDGPVVFSERVIPGGTGDVYIDIAGAPTDRLVLPLYAATWTGLDTLRARKGTVGTLTYGTALGGGVTITGALLVDVRLSDVAPLGQTHAEAEWKVITP
jgi:hypothetical protein